MARFKMVGGRLGGLETEPAFIKKLGRFWKRGSLYLARGSPR